MKRVGLILTVSMSVLLGGCVLRGKTPVKVSATPPAPKPVAAPAPAPTEPLSIPQTQADLPTPQPISPEALATTNVPEGPVESQTGAHAPRRAGPVAGPPKPETAPAQVIQDQPAATQPPKPARPPLQEILPAAELKKLQDSADARKREIRKVLDQMRNRRLNARQQDEVSRIRSFLQLSDKAEAENDIRRADALAERAEVLVGELKNGR